MALATRCPHCGTTFRVAADQLKLRGGIVRCGACQQVFDGSASLVDLQRPDGAPATPAAAPVAAGPAPVMRSPAPSQSPHIEPPASAPAPAIPEPPAPAPAPGVWQPRKHVTEVWSPRAPTPEPPARQAADDDLDLNWWVDDSDMVRAPAGTPDDALAAPPSPPDAHAPPRHEPTWDDDPEQDGAPVLAEVMPEHPAAAAPPRAADAEGDAATLTDHDAASPDAAAPEPAASLADDAAMAEAGADVPPGPPLDDRATATQPWSDEIPWIEEEPATARLQAPTDDPPMPPAGHAIASPAADHDRIDPRFDPLPQASAPAASAMGGPLPLRQSADVHFGAAPTPAAPPRAKPARRSKLTPTRIEPPRLRVPEIDEPEFVRRGRQRERWGRHRNLILAVGALLLLVLLAAQAVLQFRNVLAARYPALRPTLAGACVPLGCKIELPARIENLAVDAGELQALAAGTYQFATLIRNQGDLVQAWPHLELTLTDADNKPLTRRVFAPADYLPHGVLAANGIAARTEQPVRLYFQLNELKPSDYHIAIFYP